MVGAAGAVTSITRFATVEFWLTLPATSVAVADSEKVDSAKAVPAVNDQSPLALVTAVPNSSPSLKTATVEPTSAVPVSVGSVVFMYRAPDMNTGLLGLVVSTVRPTEGPNGLSFPAISIVLVLTKYEPSVASLGHVNSHMLSTTVVVPT